MVRRITGYHVSAIMVGFFGNVIAVNFWMARLATTTFGGAAKRSNAMSQVRIITNGSAQSAAQAG